MCGHSEKAAVYTPSREASGGTNPADTLILDLPPPAREAVHSGVESSLRALL